MARDPPDVCETDDRGAAILWRRLGDRLAERGAFAAAAQLGAALAARLDGGCICHRAGP
jgi:hypothetical protein